MLAPNVLSYQRWLDLYAAPMTSLTLGYAGAGRTGGASTQTYTLDLGSGSYAVAAHEWSKQFTPERWRDAIRSGTRDTGSVEPASWELAGAL